MISLSYSGVRDWKRCRKLYYYRRILNLRRKRTTVSMRKGSVIHELVETYLTGNDLVDVLDRLHSEFAHMFEEEREYYGDIPAEAERIINSYVEQYPLDPEMTIEVELEFQDIPISRDVALNGRIDWVFEDDRGVWVCDHKTTGRSIPTDTFRLWDLQTAIYTRVVREMGYEPRGIVFNYIKTKPPTVPKILKAGGMSKRKIITDERTILKVIEENGLDPSEYEEMLATARKTEFFSRKFLPKPDMLVDNLMVEIDQIGKEIQTTDAFYRSPGRECETCEFFPVCMAELSGLDSEFLVETEYYKRKRGGEEIDGAEEDSDGESAE